MDTETALVLAAGVQAVASVVLVIITAIYVRFGYQQAAAAVETATLARQSALDMFRPLVTVKPSTYRSGGIPYLRLDLSNEGMGRAAIVALECQLWTETTPLQLSTTFLGTGDKAFAVAELRNEESDGSDGLVRATYSDAFNRHFRTTHRLHLDPDGKGSFTCLFLGEEQELLT
jgi:hypothetical protein